MRYFITGGAGFIGGHLIERLVSSGHVTVYDNLSAGKYENIARFVDSKQVTFICGDVLNQEALTIAMRDHDIVYHLSASSDIMSGHENTCRDLQQGTIATSNVLNAMHANHVPKIMYSSSGTVYGNFSDPCSEDDIHQLPISFYGASKLASEALISTYTECLDIESFICRFGNVVGHRLEHGVMFDFCQKLLKHPDYLDVCGNGKQTKPYLHIDDCISGILHVVNHANGTKYPAIFNIAPLDGTSVDFIAKACIAASNNPNAEIQYTGGEKGWKGDIPISQLNPRKLADFGFAVSMSSDQAAQQAVHEIAQDVFGRK